MLVTLLMASHGNVSRVDVYEGLGAAEAFLKTTSNSALACIRPYLHARGNQSILRGGSIAVCRRCVIQRGTK